MKIQSFVQDHTNMFYRNALISSDTVGGGGGGEGCTFEGAFKQGAFIDGFYLLGGRSFEGAFIQSITVIRTCFSF